MSSIDYLRDATIQALANGAWDDADDLFTVLKSKVAQQQPVTPAAELPSGPPQTSEEATGVRSAWFWISVIRQQFIPHLESQRIYSFSAAQLHDWIRANISLTPVEIEVTTHHNTKWKKSVSRALRILKDIAELEAPKGGTTYRLVRSSQVNQLRVIN